MNQAQRREYSDASEKQMKRYESIYLRKLYTAIRSQIVTFTADMRVRGIARAQAELFNSITNQQIAPVINDLHVNVGLFFGRKAWREINRSVTKAGFGFNEAWTEAIIAFFQNDMFVTVSGITETTRQQILEVLSEAMRTGESIEWIARRLEEPKMLLWRARLIARTEIAKGAFAGRKVAADESEWETDKEWISANDHRTRDGHRAVDGEVISQPSRFQVRHSKGVDMMEGPGDPDASIANLANCRCSMATVVRVDQRGRPIPKRRITVIQPGEFIRPGQTITI